VATMTITMPNFGQTTGEGTIVVWLRGEGDRVERGQPLAEVETDKTTVQVEAFAPGYLRRILRTAPAVVTANTVIALLTSTRDELIDESALAVVDVSDTPTTDSSEPTPAKPVTPAVAAPSSAASRRPAVSGESRLLVTPMARRVADQLGVGLERIVGSGPGGRILEGDVRAQAEQARQSCPSPASAAVTEAATTNSQPGVEDSTGDDVELTAVRRTTATRMLRSVQEAPQFALSVDVETTTFEKYRTERTTGGAKLSFTAFLVKVVALALHQHPEMNATYRDGRVRRLHEINVGLAMATPGGLLVPVIRQADRKTVDELTSAIHELGVQARAHTLWPAALGGSTFTISNLGMYGVDRFTAILNPPEAGILAVGRIYLRPVAVETRVETRPIVTLTLTVDHRALDGSDAALFLSTIRRLIEQPEQVLDVGKRAC
jgi:pyruvate dehydrogenase E2 component (dihydrolipoamide acetyltransferase)